MNSARSDVPGQSRGPILCPMASLEISTASTRRSSPPAECWIAPSGASSRSPGDAKGFLQGQVSNDVEALTPGSGCYATFLTPKGKMLGDLRILDTGDELLLDTERVALQELFNMIRRFSSATTSSCTSARSSAAWCPCSARPPRSPRPDRIAPLSTPTCGRRGRDRVLGRSAPTSASISFATPRTPRLCSPRWRRPARCRLRGGGRLRACRARPAALRHRPRRHGDPSGGRSQRSRGVIHEGLLRGPGDRGAALLPRQAQPAAAGGLRRSEPASRARDHLRRAHGRAPEQRRPVAGSGPVGLALVRREAPPGSYVAVGTDEIRAVVVELPFQR